MIVNIIKATGTMERPLLYNELKVGRDVATLLAARNVDSDTSDGIARTFMRYEARNRRSRDVSFHMNIDPAPGVEQFTDGQAVAFAERMMEGLGYGNQPWVIYRHDDIARTHYHVVSIRTDANGKKIPDRQERSRCYRLMCGLAEEFGYRVGSSGTKRSKSGSRVFDRDGGDVVAQVSDLYRDCLGYTFSSWEQFLLVLRSHRLGCEERTGRGVRLYLQGLDGRGRPCTGKISGRMAAMDFYGLYSARALECASRKAVMRRERERVCNMVSGALAVATSPAHFRNILAKAGIAFELKRDGGEIGGAVFVDHVSRSAFSLPELSEGLSLDAFRECDALRVETEGRQDSRSTSVTLGDLLSGARGSKSHEKDIRDDPRRRRGRKMR